MEGHSVTFAVGILVLVFGVCELNCILRESSVACFTFAYPIWKERVVGKQAFCSYHQHRCATVLPSLNSSQRSVCCLTSTLLV